MFVKDNQSFQLIKNDQLIWQYILSIQNFNFADVKADYKM